MKKNSQIREDLSGHWCVIHEVLEATRLLNAWLFEHVWPIRLSLFCTSESETEFHWG